MGVSINNATVAELTSGIDFLLEGGKLKASDAPVAVRTADGIDGHFYLDIESGRFLITPDSFYRKGKSKSKAKKSAPNKDALTAEERQQLADAFDALLGVASEYEPDFFDQFHKRKGDGLFGELEKIFIKLAPEEMKKVLP